jgi:PKD repeat protein
MKHAANNHRTPASVLRPLLAAVLMLGAVALLARAGSSTQPAATSPGDSAQVKQAAASTPGVPRFQNFVAPAGIADAVGEPTIGCNWNSETTNSNSMFNIPNGGRVMLFGGFSSDMYRATFNDCSSPAGVLWEAKPLLLAATPRAAGDPILFTDSITGRTFVSQLEGLTPAGSTTDITDNDGDTFSPSEGSSLPSDIDHQTFGGGRFHDPKPPTVGTYPHAVYYAAQSVADARTAVSLDGGFTFGPGFPMYTIDDCAGLHGHIKVAPNDGTVYVPNRGCGGSVPFHEVGGRQAVIVSEDNGITWDVRPIPDATTHGSGNLDNSILGTRDPSVAIDAAGTVYFVYQSEERLTPSTDPADKAGDSLPKVAVSHDKGLTWQPSVYVGANVLNGGPVRNATFVAAIAGDAGRAAVAFFGTETGGNNWQCGEGDDCSGDAMLFPRDPFEGVWYLYVSVTYDGGQTWVTQNVTPGDPIQRGGICGTGTCRNLLDFMDIQVDKQGRILVAGEDGCVDACVQGGENSFTAKGFITRQSGGKRLFAQFDPVEPALAGAPLVRASINAAQTKVELAWDVPDDSGSDITGYNIYRRVGEIGLFTLIATVPQTNFTDTTFAPNQTNYYHVTAVNGMGEGPFCGHIVPVIGPDLGNICELPGFTELTDPAGDTNAAGVIPVPAGPGMDLLSLKLAQPLSAAGKLIFRINTDAGISPQPVGSGWYTSFRCPDGVVRGVRMFWGGPTPSFQSYVAETNFSGGTDGRFPDPATIKPTEPESNYDPDAGVVEIVVKMSDLNINPGETISGFNAAVTYTTDPLGIGAGGTATFDTMPDSLAYTGSQTLTSCLSNLAPTAKLVANPEQGNPPLTVSFDGSASVDPDAGDSIASYTFSFGDGSPDATQSSPTISHTYKHGGGFFATLTVKDSKGLQSANIASVPIKVAAQLLNLSTRLRVEPGDRALIGGLIILGSEPKRVIMRGIGPSMTINGSPFPGRLEDPTLELYNSANVPIASNDDWKSDQAEVEATGVAPTDDHESAIVRTLDPGTYTVILRGKNNTSGVALVETYDIGLPANSRLGNLSSRGFIGTGDHILIGGFHAGPQTAAVTRVVFRAMGPSLAAFNVPSPMQDPTLEVRDRNGALLASNDNWETHQKAEIQAAGLAPGDFRESAIVMTNFEPGPYTAVVRGKDGSTGIGLVEIYDVQQ